MKSSFCPKCGCDMDRNVAMNALSRRDNKTSICSRCGTVEALEDINIKNIPNPHGLPRSCYYNDLGYPVAKPVLLTFGLSGFIPVGPGLDGKDYRELNKSLGIDEPTAEAMLAGSMWGWDTSGTNPKKYKSKAEAV